MRGTGTDESEHEYRTRRIGLIAVLLWAAAPLIIAWTSFIAYRAQIGPCVLFGLGMSMTDLAMAITVTLIWNSARSDEKSELEQQAIYEYMARAARREQLRKAERHPTLQIVTAPHMPPLPRLTPRGGYFAADSYQEEADDRVI